MNHPERKGQQSKGLGLNSSCEELCLAKVTESFPPLVFFVSFVVQLRNLGSVQHRQRIGLADELRVEVQIKIQPSIRLGVVDAARHQEIGGVMVSL